MGNKVCIRITGHRLEETVLITNTVSSLLGNNKGSEITIDSDKIEVEVKSDIPFQLAFSLHDKVLRYLSENFSEERITATLEIS